MFVLFDYTINSKDDLKYVNSNSKINNLYINLYFLYTKTHFTFFFE